MEKHVERSSFQRHHIPPALLFDGSGLEFVDCFGAIISELHSLESCRTGTKKPDATGAGGMAL